MIHNAPWISRVQRCLFAVSLLMSAAVCAEPDIRGRVMTNDSFPGSDCIVKLALAGISDTTDSTGSFVLPLPPSLSAKSKILKIFLSFFQKIPPARKKEKEWKILRFLKPVANWRGSRRIQEIKLNFEKRFERSCKCAPQSYFPVFWKRFRGRRLSPPSAFGAFLSDFSVPVQKLFWRTK